MKQIQCVILGLTLTMCVCWSASQEPLAKFTSLRVLDFPSPFCETGLRLEVAGDHFVEIENNLPGRNEYNSLIRLYQKKKWLDLAAGIKAFRSQFESSPLIEAVEFLELQTELDQVSEKNNAAFNKAENKFRDLILLYPRSNLSPVVHASLANQYLKMGAYAKALGLYRAAREQNPFHSTSCVHLMGEAEANFLIGNLDESQRVFNSVVQKCQANRLLVAAKIRLIDVRRQKGESLSKIEKEYEKVRNDNPILISRFHPELLFNLGEIKYRAQSFPSSTFYFNDFARSISESHGCQPGLHKRLADLDRHGKKSPPEVIGKYLAVYESYPKTDVGRFSRAHAFLLDFGFIAESELKRRLDIVDSEIETLRDSELKDYALIEKGLALLERKDESGLDILKPLKDRKESLFRGELDTYIRGLVLDQARNPMLEVANLTEKAKDKKVFEPLERFYTEWFYKTPDAEKAEVAYRSLVVRRFNESLSAGSAKGALSKLERWRQSDLFQKKWVDPKIKLDLGRALGMWWLRQPSGPAQTFAKLFLEKEETLSEFFQPGGEALWAQAYLDINDPSGLQKTLKNVPKERSLAGKNGKDELLALSPFSLILGKAFRLLGDFSKSEFYLNKVSDPALEDAALSEKMKTWVSLGKANLAIESGLKALGRKPANQNQEMLFQLRDAVVEGKQWKLSEKVFQTAQKVLGNEKTILPFVTMEGRALLEQGKCKESNQIYSEALKLDPTAKDVAETRFNRGRCLSQLKDLEGAKKEWQEVASLKDEFWSPLAVNELKLLEKP